MPVGVVPINPKQQFTDANGVPLSGGSVTVYLAGTTTEATTYQDRSLLSANTNPVILNARGECTIWADSAYTYKYVVKDSSGVTIYTEDNIPGAADTGAAADAAEDWAIKTSAAVEGSNFSSKEYAQGTQASTGGSSKNWAQQTGSDVTGASANSRSAKAWAQEDLTGATLGGSAKDWAQSSNLPDGTNKSAKSYAADAEAARDIAFTNANVYANTTDGLAATALNGQFTVISSTDEAVRYREDSGPVATEVARFPTRNYIDRQQSMVAQRFGHQSDTIPDGTTNHPETVMLFAEPTARAGRITRFRMYAGGAATISIHQWTRSGDTITKVSTALTSFAVVAGMNTVSLDISVDAGVYLSVGTSAATAIRISVSPKSPGRGYFRVSGIATSVTVDGTSIPNVQNGLHHSIEVEYRSYVEQMAKHEVRLGRIDSIGVIGNSYMAGSYHPYKKTPIGLASQMSAWNFHNFSYPGGDLFLRVSQVRGGNPMYYRNDSDGNNYANGTTQGGATYRDYRPSYTLIILGTNHTTVDDLLTGLHDVLETVRGMGSTPLLMTEINASTWNHAAVYRQFAERYGGHFLGDLSSQLVMFPTAYAGFDTTGHKSMRVTSALYSQNIARAIDALLGAPRSGLKLYRPRPNVTISGTADLMFELGDDLEHGKNQVWQEVENGGGVVMTTDAAIAYMDEVNNTGSYATTAEAYSEYDKAMNGHALSFTDYALMTVHLDAQPNNVREVRAYVGTGLTAVYARDVFLVSGSYPAQGAEQGNWRSLPVTSDGWAIIRDWEISGKVSNTGRVDFLLEKSGAFTLQNPRVEWWGAAGKGQRPPVEMKRPRGSEMISTPFPYSAGALASGWTSSGTPSYANTANGGDLPLGATGYVKLDSSDTISFAISGITADPYYGREVEISVWACGEKALVNSATYAASPSTAPMSNDSWDGEQITIENIVGGNAAKSTKTLMPFWQEVRVRTWLPAATTALTVRLGCASSGTNPDGTTKAVLVARGSCKLVEG